MTRRLTGNVGPSLLLAVALLAGCGEPESPDRPPNILIAISDDQSYPHASAYGSRMVDTPHFDRVASEGILFTNAFVASPGCSPSRAALLTGRYPWQLEEAGTHASYFQQKYVTFPDLLQEAGYHIGYTGKGWGPGDWEQAGRPHNPAGPAYNDAKLEPKYSGIRNVDYAENFSRFMTERDPDQPFYFWYGASEPHRVFEDGSGIKEGKTLDQAEVPAFLPDVPVIQSDLLDYAVEIEHFDDHLGRIIQMLEAAGELDNTIIVVTADNGMAFPRAKANAYEYGIHVPLAIRWGNGTSGSRTVDDLVSLVDLAPTILGATGVEHPGDFPMSGRSLENILQSEESGRIDPSRTHILAGRERHSSSRYNSLGYPQRAIRTYDHLLIQNYRPERWPAGTPEKLEDGQPGPKDGGYHDIDVCPTLTWMIENKADPKSMFDESVNHRPAIELFDVRGDADCLNDLAASDEVLASELRSRLDEALGDTGDPRAVGEGDVFETYIRVSRIRHFQEPDWAPGSPHLTRPDWLDLKQQEP